MGVFVDATIARESGQQGIRLINAGLNFLDHVAWINSSDRCRETGCQMPESHMGNWQTIGALRRLIIRHRSDPISAADSAAFKSTGEVHSIRLIIARGRLHFAEGISGVSPGSH